MMVWIHNLFSWVYRCLAHQFSPGHGGRRFETVAQRRRSTTLSVDGSVCARVKMFAAWRLALSTTGPNIQSTLAMLVRLVRLVLR